MSEQTQAILTAYGQVGVELLRSKVPNATGKTSASIRYEVTINQLKIFARGFFSALETGRGPRKSSTDSGFDSNLLAWMAARGIGAGLSEKKKQQLARFFTWRINRDGDKTFKSGGKQVYSDALKKLVKELTNEIRKQKLQEYRKEFLLLLNGSLSSTTT